MTFEEIEPFLIKHIKHFLDIGPKERYIFGSNGNESYMVLEIRNSGDTGDMKIHIRRFKNNNQLVIHSRVDFDADEDEMRSASWSRIMPESEEEYFQQSTVEDMCFSYDFYTYMEEILTF
ncbi:hypothetical protein ENKO_426 [Klebsiella phage fENko-Kae01]|nr:hypothetical protein [Klebsiella phage fENko-Kae01]